MPLSAQTNGSGTFVFDEVAARAGFAVVNPFAQADTITVIASGTDGTPISHATVKIDARSRVVDFLRSLSGLSGMAETRESLP